MVEGWEIYFCRLFINSDLGVLILVFIKRLSIY